MVSPVTAGLVLDLSTAALPVTDGTEIQTWTDSSGAGNNALYNGGEIPRYYAGLTPKGGPAIKFVNADYTFNSNAIFNASSSAEFFAVLRTDGGKNAGFYQFGGGDYTYYPFNDNNIYDGSFTATRFSFPAHDHAAWHIYSVRHDGTTRTTTVNGIVVHTATVAFTAPAFSNYSTLRIGRQFTNYPWRGDIAEIIAYNRVLTTAERTQVTNYLKAQHFVSASNLDVVPIRAGINLTAEASDPIDRVAAPSIAAAVRLLAVVDAEDALVVPPISAQLSMAALLVNTTVSITMTSPVDGEVIVTSRPTFTVGLQSRDDTAVYTLEVQYDDNDAFSNPVTLSGSVASTDGGAILTAISDVPPQAFWRARLLSMAQVQVDWTEPFAFTVNASTSTSTLPIAWTVSASAERPTHLWHFDPPGATPGEPVTVYGQGFASTGTVYLGDDAVDTTTWVRVAATAVTDETRLIDGDVVDPEHYEITFITPEVDGPGLALTVEA